MLKYLSWLLNKASNDEACAEATQFYVITGILMCFLGLFFHRH